MMVSTKGRYALMIMEYIASHRESKVVSLKDIADNKGMGIKYLEIIVSSLNKAGMLESVRGKNGGYRLKKEPSQYTLFEILRAAEGSLVPVNCVEKGFCPDAEDCNTHKMWCELDALISDFLKSKTLEDIL